MCLTASNLGYAPATLSLIALMASSDDQASSNQRASLPDVENRFKRLLQTEHNPDVLTLQGLMYLRDRRADAYALRYFDQAIQAARRIPYDESPSPTSQPHQQPPVSAPTARPPRWTYEGPCHLERGIILAKQGRTAEAEASLRIAALELDLADGYAELAKLLPQTAPERETYLLKAAQAGNAEACRVLALDAADTAADSALPRADREAGADMAYEWALVEPDLAKREELLSQVAGRVGNVKWRGSRGR